MKRTIISILMLSCCLMASGQSTNRNYMRTRTHTDSTGTSYRDKLTYYDGLGRPVQEVAVKGNPSGTDLTALKEYDAYGREIRSWLPVASGTDGSYKTPSTLKSTAQGSSGYGDTRPYTETAYELSTLDRVKQSTGPGSAWQSKPTTVQYTMNGKASELSYSGDTSVALYYATSSGLKKTGYADFAKFYAERTTDGEGRKTIVLKDKEGRTVLERRMDGSTQHDTYYVYDAQGNLRYVLPPLAADAFEGTSGTFADTNASLKNHAYIYRYDGHGRIIYKKLPGCEPVYYIYDKGGRLILSQDGVQRPLNKWTFTIPDVHGRTVLKGECTSSSLDYSACPYASTVVKATRNNGTSYFGYSISGITLSSAVMHSVYYYDDYAFIGKNNVPTSLNYTTPSTGYGVRYTGGYRGVLTGEAHGNLISDRAVNGYTYAAHYYDSRGRVIQSVRTNHMAGKDTEYVGYDFTGNPLKRKHVHTASGKTTRTEEYSYVYDTAGRLMSATLATGGKTVPTSYSYDKFGRSASVQYHSKSVLKTSYTYNVRSWLSAQTGSLFGQNLTYDSGGNIATQQWTQNGNTRTYTYGYDGLERLKSAAYSGSGNFATAYTYDKSGNMKTLQRYNSSLIDNLTYTYSGNRITKVEDATGNAAGFKNGSTATTEYTYDNNGNLTKDSNKGIASITYNSLNLPSVVTFSNGSTVIYTYTADGKKLSTEHVISGTTTITNYAGNVVYENNVQKKLLTQHGYVDLTDSTHYFYIKDHLGNTRVVADEDGSAKEQNEYYPFGLNYTATTYQPYKYNGKELDTKGGLNWYDYGARHYDAALGRFLTVDPLAEKMMLWSPYGYCLNNPMKYVDKDGEVPWLAGLIGGAVDYAFQVAGNRLSGKSWSESFTNVDMKQVAASAAISMTGVGLGNVINKGVAVTKIAQASRSAGVILKKTSEIAVDASMSAVSQYAEGKEISMSKIAKGVIIGQIGGKAGDQVKRIQQNTETGKLLHRQADHAQRVARHNSSAPRNEKAKIATQKANDYGKYSETAVSTALSESLEEMDELIKSKFNSNK